MELYKPSIDTFLLIDSIGNYFGNSALEIGTGSGLVSNFLSRNFKKVIATDIDFQSLIYCKKNTNPKINLICCDTTRAINIKFDLIVSNPPYLPNDSFHDVAIHGGKTGVEKTIHFLESVIPKLKRNGFIIFIVSSLSDISKLDKFIYEKKIQKKIINQKKLFFEILYVYELSFK
jgi:release factor glutamine methyltransferase